MDFDVQVAHTIEEIGQEAWDRLGQDRPFASYRWYHFSEKVLADNTPIYIVLSWEGEPVARATFWLRRQEWLPISSRPMRYLLEKMLRRWPLLMCKSPLVSASGLTVPEPPLRDAALETIAHVAYEQARRHHVSFVGFVYLKKYEAEYRGWPDTFATVEPSEPGTCLPIVWSDFESYLSHLSKSARKDYRRHRNRAADLGIEIKQHPITTPLNDAILDEAMALIHNVDKHHNSSPHPWGRALLTHAHMVDAVWLTAEIADRVVGCGFLLGDRGVWFLALLGLDYEVQYVYFQLFYEALRCVIEKRAQVLWGGAGAYEMKRKLKFQIEAKHYIVFAGRGPLLHRFGRWAATMEG
jgi:predicted N-acyltransferase